MTFVTKILVALLIGGLFQARAQERSETPKEREKKATEAPRAAPPSQERQQPAVSRPPARDVAPRIAGESSTRLGTGVPLREPSSNEGLRSSRLGAAQGEEIRRVFSSVQDGLADASIGRFSPHFGSHISLALRGGESGTYSANQAYYVLESYLRSHKLVEFSFETVSESGANPYATGGAGFAAKGGRESAQVYVALSRAGERWVITQINIY